VAASDDGNGDRKRLLLLIPISAVVTLIWTVAAIRAVAFGDTQTLLIVSAPFSLLCGFVFGRPWK
jgi:hypothetical protein